MIMSKEILALDYMIKEYVNGNLDLDIPIEASEEYYEENLYDIVSDTEKYEMIKRGITAEEAMQLFISHSIKQGNKESTLRGKIKRIKSFVKYLCNYDKQASYYHNFSQLGSVVISDYLSSRTRNKASMHMSSSYAVLKTYFKYLTKEKIFIKNPMNEIHKEEFERIGIETDNVIYSLDNNQLKHLISSLNTNTKIGLRFATIIYLMLDTGIQGHELANVKIDNLDLTKRVLYITDENGIPTRQVEISLVTANIVRRYIENISPYNYKSEYLVRGIRTNEKLDSRYICISLRRLGKKLGINLSGTVLRDTFAIRYLEKTKDTITLASIMGVSIYHLNARYKNYSISDSFLLGDMIYGEE